MYGFRYPRRANRKKIILPVKKSNFFDKKNRKLKNNRKNMHFPFGYFLL